MDRRSPAAQGASNRRHHRRPGHAVTIVGFGRALLPGLLHQRTRLHIGLRFCVVGNALIGAALTRPLFLHAGAPLAAASAQSGKHNTLCSNNNIYSFLQEYWYLLKKITRSVGWIRRVFFAP